MTVHEDLDLMPARELAEYLGVTVRTLRNWRRKGEGPAFIRIGEAIHYKRSTVAAWLKEQPR